MEKIDKIKISRRTIVFFALFIIFLLFLYQIRNIILLLFIAVTITAALHPVINKMEKYKIPRPLATIIIYLFFWGGLIGMVSFLLPQIISQMTNLMKEMPRILSETTFLNFSFQPSDYSEHLLKIPGNVFKFAANAFSNIVRIFTLMVIIHYLLLERKRLKKHLSTLFNRADEERVGNFIKKLEERLGGWVRGELLLMLIVGLMSYLGLLLLDIKYALPLAVIAGLLEIVPNVGPTIASVPAIIIGWTSHPALGLAAAALYILIQQLENNIIVPKVMKETVGIHPLVTLVSLMIGLEVGGVLGSILAVPIVIFSASLLSEFYPRDRIPNI